MSDPLRAFAAMLSPAAPVSGQLLHGLADELDHGGPVAELLRDHPAAGTPLFGVRALSGLQLLMMAGKAPRLLAHVEAARPDERTWPLARAAIMDHESDIRAALDRTVQQHHPSRAAFLLRGLSVLGASRVRLLEIGACAGLTLLLDRCLWIGPGWAWGDPSSPVRLSADGPPPPAVEIVERAGCDLQPRSAADPGDVLILRSFLPPELRRARTELDLAIELAVREPVRVDQAGAADWLRAELAAPVEQDVVTVVWHSLTWLHLPAEERDRVDAVLATAAQTLPLARIAYEPRDWSSPPALTVRAPR